MMSFWTFIIASLIIILIPGTGAVFTISTGLTRGKKASILAAFSCTMGIVPHLSASIALSSLIMYADDRVFWVIKLAGALYLLYLGLGMLLAKTKIDFGDAKTESSAAATIRQGILINLLNPKLTLFFFSFLPQYISAESNNYIGESLCYSLAFMLLTFVVFAGYGILAGAASSFIVKSPKRLMWIQRAFGIVFIAFAIQLGISSL